jgi:transcriptional regulator GlxA family with amidase domain
MDQRVGETLTYLEERWKERIRVEDLARRVNLSRRHLAKLFHEQTGESIKQHQLKVRLEEAVRLLRGTHASVSEICYEVGFQDLANFCHTFKLRFGCSPSQLRERRWPQRIVDHEHLRLTKG